MVICFSALQRAENFSIGRRSGLLRSNSRFQCSSASRKFLNSPAPSAPRRTRLLFQCSSASRKFLNQRQAWAGSSSSSRFQCSSASRKFLNPERYADFVVAIIVSVLFSEPKISQLNIVPAVRERSRVSVLFSEPKISQSDKRAVDRNEDEVSVLFSEPKISQCGIVFRVFRMTDGFSALQRAENFSIKTYFLERQGS